MKHRVLMVCMGNICRSPTAEAVLRAKLSCAGLDGEVSVDSAGTHAYHVGAPPDERSQRHARHRGYDLAPLRARVLVEADYEHFDLLLAMDWDNLARMQADCPVTQRGKLLRLMEFAPALGCDVVPDPYYGEGEDFERVLDLVEGACEGLLAQLFKQSPQAR